MLFSYFYFLHRHIRCFYFTKLRKRIYFNCNPFRLFYLSTFTTQYTISPSLSFTSSRVAAISSRTRSPVLQRIGIALCHCISSYIFAGDNYSPCRASKGNPSVSLRRTVCFNMENSLFY
ncbi:hypothetical protein DXC91_11060 [Bacteroides uniformis]|uniref:Uncharacterized protein n=1 Tax=Bacteroides uniformis TaxID=820 RepID=A0A3E4Q0B3_BACUN|nr:hypothetical protein DXC91_11060 [Bacteroides uniformis]RJV05109.1 hypothetical protein DWZ67_10680 [Bacteroides sp. AF34-31BH]